MMSTKKQSASCSSYIFRSSKDSNTTYYVYNCRALQNTYLVAERRVSAGIRRKPLSRVICSLLRGCFSDCVCRASETRRCRRHVAATATQSATRMACTRRIVWQAVFTFNPHLQISAIIYRYLQMWIKCENGLP